MLKVMGAVLLLAGSTWLGLAGIGKLTGRVTALRSLTEALELMERELSFRQPPMRELLGETARRAAEPAADFLQACADGMDELQGRPLSELWERTARERLPALKKSDRTVLLSVGAVLGRFDAEGQRCAIAAARTELSGLLSAAAEERRRQGRVYGALGVAAGAFLVIVLF